ncbi:leukocyte elastase inhibitor-like isoform X1 [Solea solea]|uniref:leukocyte elastase inhibitor-like isoform X1 n=1 Tax=Solea solea TaxID=90069 RepID=UPI00272D31A1|nr:leukocyte elastase inhibitor-like isoform X1 [Solea solea]
MASPSPPVSLDKANTTFCLDLLKQLSEEDKTANIFFSPFSISSALAMVMLGAGGNTASQISEVLCFTEKQQPPAPGEIVSEKPSAMRSQMNTRLQMQTQIQQSTRLPKYLLEVFSGCSQCLKNRNSEDDVHAKFSKLLETLNNPDVPYNLSVANRLYGEQTFQFLEGFLAGTKKHYNAELESLDFNSNAEEARVKINSWVEKKTQDKIKDLLASGVVDSATVLVLVNAIYFKGNWDQQFEEDSTIDADFRLNKNDTKPVKMMRQKSKFSFATIPEANCKILEMPYEGKDLSMFIILPNDIEDDTTGLEKLEKELTYEKFVEWTHPDLMGQTEIEVRLPRFKMEETYDMNDVLKSMGIVDAFDLTKSDFSGMSPATNLVLSKVVHKAFLEVNEEGTEAAAATAAVISERFIMIPEVFIADHPFLFFILHKTEKSVLFVGRFCSPV